MNRCSLICIFVCFAAASPFAHGGMFFAFSASQKRRCSAILLLAGRITNMESVHLIFDSLILGNAPWHSFGPRREFIHRIGIGCYSSSVPIFAPHAQFINIWIVVLEMPTRHSFVCYFHWYSKRQCTMIVIRLSFCFMFSSYRFRLIHHTPLTCRGSSYADQYYGSLRYFVLCEFIIVLFTIWHVSILLLPPL